MRDDGVLADVFGDVFLGVVRPHLLLVDVLFEDVAEHVGVDFFAAFQRAVVQVPVPGVEEGKKLFKGFVGHVDVVVCGFKLMHVEQAAVQIGDVGADELGQACVARLGLAQPFVEQAAQKLAVKAVELALACCLLHLLHAVLQIVLVSVQKAFFLDEIDEHQPVEHERGVPRAVCRLVQSGDEGGKGVVLGLELVVKTFGDLVAVEGAAQAGDDVGEGDGLFFFQRPDDLRELLA